MSVAEKRAHTGGHMVRMADGRRVMSYSLADPEMADRVQALMNKLGGSKEESIKLLKKAGILNRSGKLSKNFGG